MRLLAQIFVIERQLPHPYRIGYSVFAGRLQKTVVEIMVPGIAESRGGKFVQPGIHHQNPAVAKRVEMLHHPAGAQIIIAQDIGRPRPEPARSADQKNQPRRTGGMSRQIIAVDLIQPAVDDQRPDIALKQIVQNRPGHIGGTVRHQHRNRPVFFQLRHRRMKEPGEKIAIPPHQYRHQRPPGNCSI
ncbi:hypothetical protein SDC9_139262 [bioreactor metagenome]|uniref:Uncharacterized protein n=1 Tax=bioreactor metagenome TaxID=1076179 RepID=A0A645DSM3_9ZZZZ